MLRSVQRFVQSLETFGFCIGPTDDPRALQLRLDFDPSVFGMGVTASRWQAGAMVVTAAAHNAGWGTAIARSAAISNLVESAAKSFEGELPKASPRPALVATPGPYR